MIPQGWRTLAFNAALMAVLLVVLLFFAAKVPESFWQAIAAVALLGNTWLRMHTTTPVCTKPVAVDQPATTITSIPTPIAGKPVVADTIRVQ